MSDKPKPRRLLTFRELRAHGVVLGRRQIDRLEAGNKFPKRVALSEKRVAWVQDEIVLWVEEKIKARSTAIGTLGSGETTLGFRKKIKRT